MHTSLQLSAHLKAWSN